MDKDRVKSIYKELMGYLSQIPIPKTAYEQTDQSTLWTRVNQAIEELNTVTNKDYDRFKITPLNHGLGDYVVLADLRTSLGGITSKLHAEYFPEENEPFGAKPSGYNFYQSQNQIQHQETYLQLVVDLTTAISSKLQDPKISAEDKSFLQQVKNGISGAKSGLDLINLILSTGAGLGFTAAQIISLLN